MRNNKQLSIGKHMALLTLLPLLILVTGLEIYFLHGRFSEMDNDLLQRGQLIARQFAASSEYGIFSNNLSFMKKLSQKTLQEADVQRVIVMNNIPHILISTGKSADMSDTAIEAMTAHAGMPAGLQDGQLKALSSGNTHLESGHVLLLVQPIVSTQIPLDDLDPLPSSQKLGTVIIEMSKIHTQHEKSKLLLFTISTTMLFLLCILYLVRVASRHITGPIRSMSESIQAIGTGKLDVRVNTPSHIFELTTLAAGINRMAADLQQERQLMQRRIDEATEQLRNLAFYDALTGLPNRRLLEDRLVQVIAACRRGGYYGALMFLDLNKFKQLNDQHGHSVGDLLLVKAGSRIASCIRSTDTVARFGGDEFVVMLNELDIDYDTSVEQAMLVAEKIRSALGQPYELKHASPGQAEVSIEHHCSASIGVVLFPRSDAQPEELMRLADAAMYKAKKGRTHIYLCNRIDAASASA